MTPPRTAARKPAAKLRKPAPKILTLDQLRGGPGLPTETVDVPEWGGAVKIRALSVAQAEEILDAAENNRTYNEMVWAACIVEPSGLTVEDIREMKASKDPKVIGRVVDAINKLNGGEDSAEDDALRQFPAGTPE
jgi:hypothetical protein